jgi:pimeloyl-ACP methyl ester carboxylesterase
MAQGNKMCTLTEPEMAHGGNMNLSKPKSIRRVALVILLVAISIAAFWGGKSLRDEYYPVAVDPSESWEPFVSGLDATREQLFVDLDGTSLETEIFIPNGGRDRKAAIVFATGSGDSLYQNYAWGLIETFILDVFLPRDTAVVLYNKRGMGKSEGDYTRSSIDGRTADVLTVVRAVADHPRVDTTQIGLVGHSEGGWVVTQAAADGSDIAFFISLAGPATTRIEQAIDMCTHEAKRSGLLRGENG